METRFGSLLQMHDMKFDQDFCALLVSSFYPSVRRLKVNMNKNIFITESDVEEIFGIQSLCAIDG